MKTWLRLLAVLLTVGGGFSGVTMISDFLMTPNSNGSVLAVTLIFTALYAFVVVAGLLFVYDARRTGPMLVALALQVPWLYLPVFEYRFAAGLNVYMAFGPPRVAQDALSTIDWGGHLETAFQFRFGTVLEGPWRIGINLVAALLFIFIWLSVRKQKRVTTTRRRTVSPIEELGRPSSETLK
jgi:hypothetical protein